MNVYKQLLTTVLWFSVFFCISLFFPVVTAHAATLRVAPTSGSFHVGSTFDVSIILDTEDQSVNAVDLKLLFPSNKLQVVSPRTDLSVVTLWTSQPRFNNIAGTIELQGGIPGGINSSSALIGTFTFRVRSVGTAVLQFSDVSKVLLNDGQGTDVLHRRSDGVFSFITPPPEGPIVSSPTHATEDTWYTRKDVSFTWNNTEGNTIEGYSYLLSTSPADVPDDTVDGTTQQATYTDVSNGTHFFHIKSLRNGIWGGTTHRAVNIDAQPPAEFPVEILPSAHTASPSPIVTFSTTDVHSGISHYELALIPLSKDAQINGDEDQPFFIEVSSPYILQNVHPGTYDVIVRAYDNAGNMREEHKKLNSISTIFSLSTQEGIIIENVAVIPWWLVIIIILVLLGVLIFIGWRLHERHAHIAAQLKEKSLPGYVQKELEELESYRKRYGHTSLLILLLGASLLFGTPVALAQQATEDVSLAPPVITTIPVAITNTEIFYAGGNVEQPHTDIVIYLQNKVTQDTRSFIAQSGDTTEWFFRNDGFLPAGEYLLWTQARRGAVYSPPSARAEFSVEKSALQFGVSRITYTLLYKLLLVLLACAIVALAIFITIYRRKIRKKKYRLEKEVHDVEEEIRRDFALLRRDIEAELKKLHNDKIADRLQKDQITREEELLEDLDRIEKKLKKEVDEVKGEI